MLHNSLRCIKTCTKINMCTSKIKNMYKYYSLHLNSNNFIKRRIIFFFLFMFL